MNKITAFLRSNPALYYLVVFLLMIIPALLLFPAAEGENQIGLIVFLGLVILANLAAVFPSGWIKSGIFIYRVFII